MLNGFQLNGKMFNGFQLNGQAVGMATLPRDLDSIALTQSRSCCPSASRSGIRLMIIALLVQSMVMPLATPLPAQSLRVEGTQFVVTTANGILRSQALVGAELDVNGLSIRIDSVRMDPDDRAQEIALHTLSVRNDQGNWQPLCEPDREGRSEAFPLPGRWDDAQRYHPDAARFSLNCTAGAKAKCVRFGYKPWREDAHGRSLVPAYEACIRMVRADYCGDGMAATENGTTIDVYDRQGVQSPVDDPAFQFEAGWTATGAVCVAHTRIPDQLSLDALVQRCPRLEGKVGDVCHEQAAEAAGAVVFNRSR